MDNEGYAKDGEISDNTDNGELPKRSFSSRSSSNNVELVNFVNKRPSMDVENFATKRPSIDVENFVTKRPSIDVENFATKRPSIDVENFARKRPSMDEAALMHNGVKNNAANIPSEDVELQEESVTHDRLSLRQHLLSSWPVLVVVLLPLLLLPLCFCFDDDFRIQGRCAYVIIIMAVFWTTEALPLAITSLMPVILLPALGVMRAKDVSSRYLNDTSMLFVGGLIVAIAIEVWDVHRRIALLVMKVVGSESKRMLLGIILVTWFLSMWISNTATTAMMMTIVNALLIQFKEIDEEALNKNYPPETDAVMARARLSGLSVEEGEKSEREAKEAEMKAKHLRMSKAVSLSVAYAANIGGVASLTGTGPNLVFFAAAQELYQDFGLTSPVSFSTWLVYGLPLSLICVLFMWAWMVLFYLRCRGCFTPCGCGGEDDSEAIKHVNNSINEEYKKLGPVTYAQGSVLGVFGLLVLAWITRDLGGSGGWGSLFPAGFVSDSTPSIFAAILLFVLPSTLPEAFKSKFDKHGSYNSIRPLLTWKHIHDKMPWSLYLLLGGGFSIAAASQASGLSAWVGQELMVFQNLNEWGILLIICYITTFSTEITSNTAIATLLMPILRQMALSLQVNPLFFMYPAAIATSFAFMLPVATPPNAIVFSHGALKVIDMVRTGIFLNISCVPILILATATWGNAFFHFNEMPAEFLQNATLAVVSDS